MPTKMASLKMFILMTTLAIAPVLRADQAPGAQVSEEVRFEGVSSDQLSADVVVLPQMTPARLQVRDPGLQDSLKGLHRGDHLSVAVQMEDGLPILLAMSVKTVSVSTGFRALVLAVAALAFWLVCFLLSGFHPQRLILGEDGRFSNSKFQTVLWFGLLVVSYLATLWLRVHEFGGEMLGGVNIPENLLLLSGMSALTFTAAKGITVTKIQNARAAGQVNVKPAATAARFWSDLTSNDCNMFDLGDFQMLIMTFLAVGTFLALIFHFLGSLEARAGIYLPDVDTTILASFGLGHGAYLTKKAVGEVGDT
jgi:hypothetical protein